MSALRRSLPVQPSRRLRALFVCLLSAGAGAPSLHSQVTETSKPSSEAAYDLAELLPGEWQMQGKFRYAPEVDWIPTRSSLSAEQQVDRQVILRHIDASQVNLLALDLLTYDEKTGVVQYVYLSNRAPTALLFEGECRDGCRELVLEQVCGPRTGQNGCAGKTSLTFESKDRFVARDIQVDRSGREFTSREVVYTRAQGQ